MALIITVSECFTNINYLCKYLCGLKQWYFSCFMAGVLKHTDIKVKSIHYFWILWMLQMA